MGDRLRAGELSRYVTSHPGQLSLAIPSWVGAMSTSLGWEGNRRSGVASQWPCVTDNSVLPTYGLNGLYVREMSTPPSHLLEYGTPLPYQILRVYLMMTYIDK